MPNSPFVSSAWLAERLGAPDIVVVDGSWYLPGMNRDPEAEYLAGHIPGAVRFDIDTVKDTSSPLPHMLPRPEAFASAVRALGIGDGMTIVIYDGAGLFSAPRVWWTFRVFGARDVVILDGGFPTWKAEGRPVEEGPPPARKPRHFTARLDHSAIADANDVRKALEPDRRRSSTCARRSASAARRRSHGPGCAQATSRGASTCPRASS
jgi:thiosulfate/3-mercaptopyruvate sulfurtransferase